MEVSGDVRFLSAEELDAGMGHILGSPSEEGVLNLIVQRPGINQRRVVDSATLDVEEGLVGDNWSRRGSSRTPDGKAHPEMQLNIMNWRFASLIAGHPERVPLAGDQLYVDLDLSGENLPPGTRLSVGPATLEVTAIPHLGCRKFVQRFGKDAMKYANSEFGRSRNLRGINAKVVVPGEISTGDAVRVLERKSL